MIERRPGIARLVARKRVIECGCRGGAEATALNPSQARLGSRAENEREGDQAVQVKIFEIFWLTLVKHEYRF